MALNPQKASFTKKNQKYKPVKNGFFVFTYK